MNIWSQNKHQIIKKLFQKFSKKKFQKELLWIIADRFLLLFLVSFVGFSGGGGAFCRHLAAMCVLNRAAFLEIADSLNVILAFSKSNFLSKSWINFAALHCNLFSFSLFLFATEIFLLSLDVLHLFVADFGMIEIANCFLESLWISHYYFHFPAEISVNLDSTGNWDCASKITDRESRLRNR